MIAFTVSVELKSSVQDVFESWLNKAKHTAMTGGEAEISSQVGAEFTAWDGYISGRNIEIQSNNRIVQSWRTTEFKEEDADSILELIFEEKDGNCQILLKHSQIPEGQPDYKQGWEDH